MAKPQQKRPAPNNFLEALRELGQDMASEAKMQVKQMVTTDIPESFGITGSGTLKPNESLTVQPRNETRSQETAINGRLHQMREEEQAQYRRNEAQMREQIKSIQEEIRRLASSVGSFAQEVQAATSQAVVNPGVYHRNFFSQLRTLIVAMRKRVDESRHWLAESNSRGKKKSYYWGQVQKSGTSYLLSSERYMVTSTG